MTAKFDADGVDKETFAPFRLDNQLDSEWKDVRLSFNDWEWLAKTYGDDPFDDYYLNGYGIQGLVIACRFQAGLEIESEDIEYNSEADTCYIHFSKMEEAIQTAQLAADMIRNPTKLAAMVDIARENEFSEL